MINMNTSVLIGNDVKPKSVIIDGDLHRKFKIFCMGKSMKIGGVIENLIGLYLNNPQTIQKLIDELKNKQ